VRFQQRRERDHRMREIKSGREVEREREKERESEQI